MSPSGNYQLGLRRQSMRKLAIGVLAATMTVAACGGSSKTSAGSTGTTAGKSSGNGSGTTASGGSSNTEDLSKLAGDFAKAKIKITYASTGGGDENITIAQDGNGKSSFSTGGSTFYSDGKSSVTCEGTGATAKCTDLGTSGAVGGANIGSLFTASFSALANVMSALGGGDKSSETIAGRDASCVKYKASDLIGRLATVPLFKDSGEKASDYDANDSATICIDKDTGYLLKISGTKKGAPQDQLVATAVSDPTDSDFTPPVTPETLPSIPGLSIPTTPTT
jgi:hypothetical protein